MEYFVQKFKVPSNNGFDVISCEDIMFIKSSGNYSNLFLKRDKKILITKQIGEIQKNLDSNNFLRIHNEYIVNINEIQKYVKGRGGYVVLKNNVVLNVSIRRKKELLSCFQ